jgi:acyl-CoA thioester hydrolase
MTFTTQLSIRWSDIDANYHVRHSVYYDFCAQHRIDILSNLGLTLAVMQQQHFGPVLFREECIFKREMRHDDVVLLTTSVAKMKADASRFTIRHQLANEQQLFAIITVDGAWMDTKLRKLVNPIPPVVLEVFNHIPRSPDFEIIPAS